MQTRETGFEESRPLRKKILFLRQRTLAADGTG
jgi:hypothetical protein